MVVKITRSVFYLSQLPAKGEEETPCERTLAIISTYPRSAAASFPLFLPPSPSLRLVTHVPRALIASVAILICSRARCNINAFAATVRCYKSRNARASVSSLAKKEDEVKREVISNGIQFPIREMRSNRVHDPPVSGRQRKETKRPWNESVGRATVVRFIQGYRPSNVHDMM